MIAEILEWCVTPCPWAARWNGLLAAQIAIRHRRRRCATHWRPHLEACRRVVAAAIGEESEHDGEHAVILGSGHLNDIDLPHLLSRFRRVTLVDAVHPLEVRWIARRGRLRCLAADLSLPSAEIAELVSTSTWTISACVLSQLPLHRRDGADPSSARRILADHLALLRRARRALLLTDVATRRSPTSAWTGILEGIDLPPPLESWIWDLAPPFEHGDPDAGTEQRLVEASLAGHAT